MKTSGQAATPHRGKWLRVLVVLGALLLGGWVQPASSQDMERLRSEVETTDRVLMRAQEVVREHGNPRAMQELEFAMRLQENARMAAHESSLGVRAMQRAFEMTKQARALAHRALNIATQQVQLEQRAMHAMRELERVLQNVMERAGEPPSERMQQLLALAERRLEQAREAFHEHRFEEALNMSLEIRRLLDNLSDRTSGRDLERMFEATRRLLERAESEIDEAGSSVEILRSARQMLEQAEANQAAGHLEGAHRQLRQAREMILHAMRLDQSPLDPNSVDRVLQETAGFVEDMGAQVRESENAEAMTLIENAQRHMERAHDLRIQNNLRQCLAEARVARNLARRAAQVVGINEF